MQLDGKVAVVTGGAQGIGRCIALEFARAGARVAIIDKNGTAGTRTCELIRSIGGDAWFFEGELSEETTVCEFAQATIGRYGRVDFLINNACFSNRGILSGCSWQDFTRVLQVGVTAPYYLALSLLHHFAPGAAIVNICSSRAFMSQADTESYTAAKGGIAALTHALAVSLSGRVRVNAISPGWIDTSEYVDGASPVDFSEADCLQHPSGRVGRCMDIARTALFLCDERNSFIDGENILVDGCMSRHMIYHADEGWMYEPQ